MSESSFSPALMFFRAKNKTTKLVLFLGFACLEFMDSYTCLSSCCLQIHKVPLLNDSIDKFSASDKKG